ncbi:MAG: HaeIII family restriction endonuclease [Pyrinomonadaceae bacterium MAG19_C2-C3]|nr:HaeIII family restriction endonuclease [Pyrinomonadaceae bacterium MAG19_C2-C3]
MNHAAFYNLALDNESANGKAFEYACARAVVEALNHAPKTSAEIMSSPASRTAARRFDGLKPLARQSYMRAAATAITLLQKYEPMFRLPLPGAYQVAMQTDAQGIVGDVRDVVARHITPNNASSWECGILVKTNNDAVKHPRLAGQSDFAKAWFNRPASPQYFARIKPVFDELERFAATGAHWDSLGLSDEDKQTRYYRPIIEALIAELLAQARLDKDMPAKLIRFLVGRQDFYKVIAHAATETTELQTYSFAHTLGYNFVTKQPSTLIKRLPVPSRIISAAFKKDSHNTAVITLDNNWSVSLRLHNASSRVERSLKLDARLISTPPERLIERVAWSVLPASV